MSSKDRLGWVMFAALGAAALGWVGYRAATATSAHAYRLTCATMPADEALSAWLAAQPGVSRPSVARERYALVVEFTLRALGPAASRTCWARQRGSATPG